MLKIKELIVLALCVMATACTTLPGTVVKLYPPSELTADCLKPSIKVATNADLAEGLGAYMGALDRCNIDKAALRSWSTDNEKP